MTIHKLTAGSGYTYLTRHVAGGDVDRAAGQEAASYYTAEGNPPGRWLGSGAATLGVAGQVVTEAQMKALFGTGLHPDADRIIAEHLAEHLRPGLDDEARAAVMAEARRAAALGRAYPSYETLPPFADRVAARLEAVRSGTGRDPTPAEEAKFRAEEARRARQAVAGFDVVFAPVKSAAIVWALHPDPAVRRAVYVAHRAAVDSALSMLEEHAAFTRTGAGGVAQIDTRGLVAAAFDHFDSRDGDPNLHTHVAVANKVQGVDGKWRSLDARGLYRITVAASEHYNSVFQASLTETLGVAWTARHTKRDAEPVWEIDGVPARLIEVFSQRRSALAARYEELVREYRAGHGYDPPAAVAHRLARQANLGTRQGKKQPRSLRVMRQAWIQQAIDAAGPDVLQQISDAVTGPTQPVGRDTEHEPVAPESCPPDDDLMPGAVAGPAGRVWAWVTPPGPAGRPDSASDQTLPGGPAAGELGDARVIPGEVIASKIISEGRRSGTVPDGPGPAAAQVGTVPDGQATWDRPGPDAAAVPVGPGRGGRIIGPAADRSAAPRDRSGAEGVAGAVPLTAQRVQELAGRVVATVGERRSTWTVWNVRAEVERQLRARPAPGGVAGHRAAVDAVTAAAVSLEHSICIEAPSLSDEPRPLWRRDGVSVYVEHGAARYTSPAILAAEERLLAAARTTAEPFAAADPEQLRVEIDLMISAFERQAGSGLDAGQRELVTAFVADPRLLVAGIGPAGTGKTTAMRAFLHAVQHRSPPSSASPIVGRSASGQPGPSQRRRVRLVPLATSAASAAVLGAELGVPAENLHKFLHEHLHGPHSDHLAEGGPVPDSHAFYRLQGGDVLLVDEAGMAGTLNLDRLVRIAADHGAVVRLLGDHRQLAAVESGGALRLIAADVGAVELTTVHRFADPAEAGATLALRTGDSAALAFYARRDRIVGGSTSAMLDAAYAGWLADVQAGKTSFMPAATTAHAAELSARARTARVTAGDVEADGVQLRDGNTAGVGDWIVTRTNQRRLAMNGGRDFIRNGDPWTVQTRHHDGSLTVRHLGHGGQVTLPAGYVSASVELLYATTVHRVQGGTVDTAHPLITEAMTREHLYVAATRARQRTTFYVATHDVLPPDDDERLDHARLDPDAHAALEVLHAVLGREGAEPSATQAIRDRQAAAESLATLIPKYQHALQTLQPGRDHDPHGAGTSARRVRLVRPASADAVRYADLVNAVLAGSGESVHPSSARLRPEGPPSGLSTGSVPSSQPAVDTVAEVDRALGGAVAWKVQQERARPALDAALQRAAVAGYQPAELLAHLARHTTVAELLTGASITEALAVRVNHHLSVHPARPHPSTPADGRREQPGVATDEPGQAREAEQRWTRLAWAIKAHENAGGHPGDLLDGPAVSGLEELLQRAEHRLTRDPAPTSMPPWTPLPDESSDPEAGVTGRGPEAGVQLVRHRYLTGLAAQIQDRVDHLAERTARERPAWSQALGRPPDDPGQRATWLRQVGIVAAYREQHQITDDDPRHPLGPYAAPDQPHHRPYWHAAGAILAARHIAEPDTGSRALAAGRDRRGSPYQPAVHQVAVDQFGALPREERDAVITDMVAAAGNLWYGHPADPDTAAAEPAYHQQLRQALQRRGHVTSGLRQQADAAHHEQASAAPARPGPPPGWPEVRPGSLFLTRDHLPEAEGPMLGPSL